MTNVDPDARQAKYPARVENGGCGGGCFARAFADQESPRPETLLKVGPWTFLRNLSASKPGAVTCVPAVFVPRAERA